MDRRQIACVLVLNELGSEPVIKSFEDRLILQKTIYLAQASGLDLGYYYGWYIRGPYCSDVADDYFAARTDPQGVQDALDNWSLDEKLRSKLEKIKSICGTGADVSILPGHGLSRARWLELLASVHYLIDRKQVASYGPEAITKKLKACDKHFTQEQVSFALKKLRESSLLPAAAGKQ